MNPILVHVHVYYPSLWPELRDCLRNIAPHPFVLHVTFVEKHDDIEEDINRHFPGSHIHIVENRGYDIAPFLYVLSLVNLDDYSYVIKLHTKRDFPFFRNEQSSHTEWRDYLLAFIKTKERFEKHLAAFESEPRIGMQADYHLHIERDIYDYASVALLKQWLADHRLPPELRFRFVGGTMFIARAAAMKLIQSYGVQPQDFPDVHDHRAQLAHVMERLLGYLIYYQGYILSDRKEFRKADYYQRQLRKKLPFSKLKRFFYQEKITSSNRKIIKVLKVPVYWKTLEQKQG